MNLTGRAIFQKGQKPVKASPLRRAARNRTCTFRIPGVCNGDPETTVGAHLRMFCIAGAAMKPDDLFMVDACSDCHAHQERYGVSAESLLGYEDVLRALIETQSNRRAAGLIRLEGETI